MVKVSSKQNLLMIPGIGVTYARRLMAAGINEPIDLLMQYTRVNGDRIRFKHLLKKSCQMLSNHGEKCYESVKNLDKSRMLIAEMRQVSMPPVLYSQSLSLQYFMIQNHYLLSTAQHRGIYSLLAYQSYKVHMQDEMNESKIYDDDDIRTEFDSNSHFERDHRKALNQRFNELNRQFGDVIHMANAKMIDLQNELNRMRKISEDLHNLKMVSLCEEPSMEEFDQKLMRVEHALIDMNANAREMDMKVVNLLSNLVNSMKKQSDLNLNKVNEVHDRLSHFDNKFTNLERNLTRLINRTGRNGIESNDDNNTSDRLRKNIKRDMEKTLTNEINGKLNSVIGGAFATLVVSGPYLVTILIYILC